MYVDNTEQLWPLLRVLCIPFTRIRAFSTSRLDRIEKINKITKMFYPQKYDILRLTFPCSTLVRKGRKPILSQEKNVLSRIKLK